MYVLPRCVAVVSIWASALAGGCCRSGQQAPAQQAPVARQERYEYAQYRMGVQARLVLYAKDEQTAEGAARAAFGRVGEVEDAASDWRLNGELTRLCAKAGGQPVPVSQDLFVLIQRSCEVSKASGGAFDITVGPYVALWRNARKTGKLPTAEEIERARKLVGWEKIRLDAEKRTVQLLSPGMKLDLGGIAKGYAGDCALAALRERGIGSALFEAGGDIVVGDAPPDCEYGWVIQIMSERPTIKPRKVFLTKAAISTSGDTEQFVVLDGKRYSHIVDPRTGLGLTDRALVTVIAKEGIVSDGLSTAASVMGAEGVGELGKRFPGVTIQVRRVVE